MSEVRTPPQKLVDLNPRWVKGYESGEVVGLDFDCPCGGLPVHPGPGCHPADRSQPFATGGACDGTNCGKINCGWQPVHVPVRGEHAWGCSDIGGAFDNLTLTPSIHAVGHWHGFVTNGMVTSC